MGTFSLGDNFQTLLELRVCTLVNVFLMPVEPQPKLNCETSHLSGLIRDKSLSFWTLAWSLHFSSRSICHPRSRALSSQRSRKSLPPCPSQSSLYTALAPLTKKVPDIQKMHGRGRDQSETFELSVNRKNYECDAFKSFAIFCVSL